MNSKNRDRHLTEDEATIYKQVRAEIEEELPELIERHHSRIAEKTKLFSEVMSTAKEKGIVFGRGQWTEVMVEDAMIGCMMRWLSERGVTVIKDPRSGEWVYVPFRTWITELLEVLTFEAAVLETVKRELKTLQ